MYGIDSRLEFFRELIIEGLKILRNYELVKKGKGVLTIGEIEEDFLDLETRFYRKLIKPDFENLLNDN